VKGLGNYTAKTQDRVPVVLIAYQGPRASVRLHDGTVRAVPAGPLKVLGVPEGGRAQMIITYASGRVVDVRFQLFSDARPADERRATPRIYTRAGGAVRRRPPR